MVRSGVKAGALKRPAPHKGEKGYIPDPGDKDEQQ